MSESKESANTVIVEFPANTTLTITSRFGKVELTNFKTYAFPAAPVTKRSRQRKLRKGHVVQASTSRKKD
jgi:hypothetical protein